ncbi:MAG TPA: biotin/lipoyl-binding protein, partial [Cyclobacteriaceae bacterium]|nr:biotin/lipoyl-binding protein [Cyclobacteriaceae bacterium]
MPKTPLPSSFFTKLKNFFRSKLGIGILVVIVIIIGYKLFHRKPVQQLIPVTQGAITESVSLTGNTTPAQSVSLSFNSSGTISHVYSDLGKKVSAGQILAELNVSDLVASLRGAQANVDAQQAKLQGLQNGSRPEDIAASQANVDKANQDLANMYAGISDTSIDSYTKADDAVHTQLDSLFLNGDTNPTFTFTTSNSQAESNAKVLRVNAAKALVSWHAELGSADQTSTTSQEKLLQDEVGYLSTVRNMLSAVSDALDSAVGVNATTLASYKASLSAALTEVNTATKNLNIISQNIASQKLTISQLQATLA